MSTKYMTLTWESALPRPKMNVLLAIADHVNDEGKGCWASYDRLSYKTKYTRRQVIRIVDMLEQDGIIVHEGSHPKFGTNIWCIIKDKIPMQPPFQQWLKEMRAKDPDLQPPQNGIGEGQNVTPPLVTFPNEEGQNVTPTAREMSPDPSFLLPSKENRESTVALATSPPSNGNGKAHGADLFDWTKIPANERPNQDHLTEYGSEEENDKAKMRPKTPLEHKIAKLCNSSYITDNQRKSLNKPIYAAYGKQKPQEYPSAEAEWKANPDLFNEYVEMCAKIQMSNTLKAPGRDALITLITRYTRHKTGWLDYRDFGVAEDAPLKQIQDKHYYNSNAPVWDQ